MKKNHKLQVAGKRFLVALLLAVLFFSACGKKGSGTTVVLTTGLAGDEIFRIENKSCRLPEIMVYLTTTQNQYEDIYGTQIWKKTLRGTTLEQNVKDTVLAELAEIKVMNLLAEKYAVSLTEREKALAQQAGADYFSSLNEAEIDAMGVDEKEIETLLRGEAVNEATARRFIYYLGADEAVSLIDWAAIGKQNPLTNKG